MVALISPRDILGVVAGKSIRKTKIKDIRLKKRCLPSIYSIYRTLRFN